jgi:hypothetical protein
LLAHGHVCPLQNVFTSPTQILSHAELQQYGSFAQSVASHAPQVVASAAPAVHTP